MFVDAATLDLRMISVGDVRSSNGGYVNTFNRTPLNTGGVFGTIKFTLLDASRGEVRLGGDGNLLDVYDYAPGSKAGAIAGMWPGAPMPYNIYCSKCVNHVYPGR